MDNTQRFTHHNLERLFDNQIEADIGAKYTKRLYLNLSTLSPYVAGPNSVKITNPLAKLISDQIKIDRAYLVSCTNSRASDLMAAAKVFKDAAKENNGKIPKIADGVNFYIAAASKLEQIAAEATGDWQIMIEAGAQPLPAGCGPCIGLAQDCSSLGKSESAQVTEISRQNGLNRCDGVPSKPRGGGG